MDGKFVGVLLISLVLFALCVNSWPVAFSAEYQSYMTRMQPEITYLGDLNKDGRVEIFDVISVAGRFGVRRGNPRFDEAVDINDDGVIDILDLTLVTKDYGKRYYDLLGPPVAYSESMNFTIPEEGNDGDTLRYWIQVRLYVPHGLSGRTFCIVREVGGGVDLYSIRPLVDSLEVGSHFGLSEGYHLLGFECAQYCGLGGFLDFSIRTSSGEYAWMDRFHIDTPNCTDNEIRYTMKTHTYFDCSDDYFLQGFVDDYINSVKLGGGDLYNDWQWNQGSGQTIYAWRDGFRYPLGYFSEQHSWKDIEFAFGEIWNGGLLDFQYLSYSNQKSLIGLPEVYAWCDDHVTDPGHYLGVLVGNASIAERKYAIGANWANGSAPGLSKRFITSSQEICIYDNKYDSCERLRLGFGIGWATPKFSETAQFGLMINLTHLGLDGHGDPYEGVRLANVTLDVYTPQSVAVFGLVYRDPNDPNTDNILELGGKIAVGATAAIANWQVGSMFAEGLMGPAGIVAAVAGIAIFKAIYEYQAKYQEEGFGESPGGNSTHRQIWYNHMLQLSPPEVTSPKSKSHIVFVGLSKELPKSCGAIKLLLRGTIGLYNLEPLTSIEAKVAFEMGIMIPVFVW